MVHPAPLMTTAPVKKRAAVLRSAEGAAMGVAIVAAMNVLKRHGKKR
jgi:hypothetical protein